MSRNSDANSKQPRLRLPLAITAMAALTVAACGTGGTAGSTATTGTAGTTGGQSSTELTASVKEFEFTPNTWTVPAGEEVTITITNEGTLKHEWVLLKEGVTITSEDELPESEEELEESYVEVEEEVEPGETKTLTFTAPPAGTYQVICAIPDHFNSGLEGTLTSTG